MNKWGEDFGDSRLWALSAFAGPPDGHDGHVFLVLVYLDSECNSGDYWLLDPQTGGLAGPFWGGGGIDLHKLKLDGYPPERKGYPNRPYPPGDINDPNHFYPPTWEGSDKAKKSLEEHFSKYPEKPSLGEFLSPEGSAAEQ